MTDDQNRFLVSIIKFNGLTRKKLLLIGKKVAVGA
jgi:hypothetical protein